MLKKRKEQERQTKKRKIGVLILLILLTFFAINLAAGQIGLIIQHQRYLENRVNSLEERGEATRLAYRNNLAELESRVATLESRPTYEKPVTHKKVQEPEVKEVSVKEHNPFKAPALDPLLPLTGIFTLYGMLKLSSPIGG